MKLINSKSREKPLLKGFRSDVIIMDKFTWRDILEWTKEYEKKQLKLPFKSRP